MDFNEYLSKKLKKSSNKRYFDLIELCNDSNTSFDIALKSSKIVFERFKALSLYANNLISFDCDEYGDIINVKATGFALMFIAKEIENNTETAKEFWHKTAQELNNNIVKFYPETRVLARLKYSQINVELNKMLASLSYVRANGISKVFQELYTVILSSFYNVLTKEDLYNAKNISLSKNYLDYISVKEIESLTAIQKELMLFIMANVNYTDILNAVQEIAKQENANFINKNHKSPLAKPIHKNTPKNMLKQFYKLMDEYGLKYQENKDIKNLK